MENEFGYLVFGGIAFVVIALLLLGRYYPGTGADVLDWKPTRSVELEAELELNDIDQMLEAQNARRRARGVREKSLEEIELDIARGLREQNARRRAYRVGQEDSAEASADLQELLALENERRRRRGRPPVTAAQFEAELRAEAPDRTG